MINYLRIGKIISLHGIKGEVKIYPFTDDVKRYDVLEYFYLTDNENAKDDMFDNSTLYEVENVKYVKNCPILKIKNYDSIEISTKLIGKNIYVDRAHAVKLNPNEYFVDDLIGLKVYDNDELLGEVREVLKTKANSIIVINYSGKDLLIPFVNDFVESIDIENTKMYVKTIKGLI